jgi:hypothetical protein
MSFLRNADRNLSESEKDAKEAASLLPSARKPKPKKKHSTSRGAPRLQQRKGRVKVTDPDVVPVDTVAYDLDLSLNHKYSSVAYRISAGSDIAGYRKALDDYLEFVEKDLPKSFPDDQYLDRFKVLFSGMDEFIKLLDLAGKYNEKWGNYLQRNILSLASTNKEIKPQLEAFVKMLDMKDDFKDYDKVKKIFGKESNGRTISKDKSDRIFGNNTITVIENARKHLYDFSKENIDILKKMPDYVIDAVGGERKKIKSVNLDVFTRIIGSKNDNECWSVFASFLKRLESVMKSTSFSDDIIDLYMTNIESTSSSKEEFSKKLDELLEKLKQDNTDQTISGMKLQGEIFKLPFYKSLRNYLLKILKDNNIGSISEKDKDNIIKETDEETATEYKKIMLNKVLEIYKEYLGESFKTSITELMEGYDDEDSPAYDWLDAAINAGSRMLKNMDSGKWDEKKSKRGTLTREQLNERNTKLYEGMLERFGLKEKSDADLKAMGVPTLEEFKGGFSRTSSTIKKFQSSNKGSLYRGISMPRTAAYHGVLMQGHPNGPTNSGWNSIDKRYINKSHLDAIIASAKKMLKDNPWFEYNWGGGSNDAPFRAALDLAIYTADNNSYQSKIDAPTYEKLLNRLASWDYDTFEDTVLNMPKDPKKRKASTDYLAMADDFDRCHELLKRFK